MSSLRILITRHPRRCRKASRLRSWANSSFDPCDAVDFNDQARNCAGEIGDIGANRMLPPEFSPMDCIASKPRPEHRFGLGKAAAQSFGVGAGFRFLLARGPLHR